MAKFVVHGGHKLHGSIEVNSAKNSAVALIIASLINDGTTTLKDLPDIEEVKRIVEVLQSIGVNVTHSEHKVIVRPGKHYDLSKINRQVARKTRSIILAIGALSAQLKSFSIPQAGGCRLGSRTIQPHLFALEKFGLIIKTKANRFDIQRRKLKPAEIVLYESGDTVTENALLAAAQIPGKTRIKMATANYMVHDLCFFLKKLGIRIEGIGTTTLTVYGKKNIKRNVAYSISEDPIEAMLFLSAAIVTNSKIVIRRCPIEFLELELLKLEKMGFKYKLSPKYKAINGYTDLVDITTYPSKLKALKEKIHALPFPGINQDNLPFFVPIATQVRGETFIHDWAYEVRAVYFQELNKLGAKINLIDNHRVTISGPTKLKAAEIICPPALRPSAIIMVAMLGAKGKSILRNVYPIHRGYEKLEERLRKIGADIELVKE